MAQSRHRSLKVDPFLVVVETGRWIGIVGMAAAKMREVAPEDVRDIWWRVLGCMDMPRWPKLRRMLKRDRRLRPCVWNLAAAIGGKLSFLLRL